MSNDNKDVQYNYSELLESGLESNPIDQFGKWYDDAINSGINFANAFCLATASNDSKPNARMLLLKGYDSDGFMFYTNSDSIKGIELQQNPQGSMVFWWNKLERQVRISGPIIMLSTNESDEYFKSRPRGSQIGAWASQQSRVIENRESLDEAFRLYEKQFDNESIPRPEYWNGYRLKPDTMEFWQGRTNRLHDRLKYNLIDNVNWVIQRLAP